MSEAQTKENTSRIIPMTADDYIILQLKDFKEEFRDSRKELNARMDRLELRQDKLETKIDALSEKIDSSTRHSQILAGSCLGITIAVLLALFFK